MNFLGMQIFRGLMVILKKLKLFGLGKINIAQNLSKPDGNFLGDVNTLNY